MRHRPFVFAAFATILTGLVLVAGCPLASSVVGDLIPTGTTTNEMTLGHYGVDFSTGETGDEIADYSNVDGETIGWPPSPSNWVASDTEVWYRPAANTSEQNFTKDMGAVTLNAVTAVPSTWDGGPEQDLAALQVGHVYVVKCLDGYAKFLVKAIRYDPNWEADVEYEFTTGTTFAN